VVERAQRAGVTRMVNISFDLESSRQTVELTKRFPFLFGAVGVHPHDAVIYDDEVEKELEQLLDNERIIAVGEIGLDFYRDHSPRHKQREVFAKQLALAERKDKPIIIHCRDAFDDVIAILSSHGKRYRGIFHAFTGDESMAKRVLDLGFHIGIGGVVTFKKSNLSDVVSKLPSDVFVLETDCPYLTPVPFRGKRNEPAYLIHVLQKVSEVTGRSIDALAKETDRNFAAAMGIESQP
jgi:TatD DNase family protein